MSSRKKKLRIFISHKMKDKLVAKKIVDELKDYAADKFEFFLSENIPFGEDWSEKIHQNLKKADWLILLYTDPTEEWDWCLYETGFFRASPKRGERRLICLHSKDVQPPKPLKPWRSVPAVHAEVVQFIRDIYQDISPDLSQEKIEDAARIIVEAVGPKPQRQYYNNYLKLSLDPNQVETLRATGEVPEGALVESKEMSLKMFGLREKSSGQWTLGEIVEDLKGLEQRGWISNLGKAMRDASYDRDFSSCQPLFHSPKDEETYRPVVHRLDSMPDDKQEFTILFVEIPNEEDPRPVGNLGTISTLMTIGRRFRWGVIENYRRQIGELISKGANDEDIDRSLEHLDSAIMKIETEAAHMGFFDLESVTSAFDEPEDMAAIEEITAKYAELKQSLVDQKKTRDLRGIVDILMKIRDMNKNFLVRAAKRYHQLLNEM